MFPIVFQFHWQNNIGFSLSFSLEARDVDPLKRRQIGTAFVDAHRLGCTALSDGFIEEAAHGGLVALGTEQKVDGVKPQSLYVTIPAPGCDCVVAHPSDHRETIEEDDIARMPDTPRNPCAPGQCSLLGTR